MSCKGKVQLIVAYAADACHAQHSDSASTLAEDSDWALIPGYLCRPAMSL